MRQQPDNFYVTLYNTLLTATRHAFEHLRTITPHEQLYIFGLYTNGEANYIVPTANTEEGLTRIAQAYQQKLNYPEPIERLRAQLRWSPTDNAYHLTEEAYFAPVEALLRTCWSDDFQNVSIDNRRTELLCLDVIAELDRQTVFGQGAERDALLLNLFKGDQSIEERLAYAAKLNSAAACTRYQQEMQAGRRVWVARGKTQQPER